MNPAGLPISHDGPTHARGATPSRALGVLLIVLGCLCAVSGGGLLAVFGLHGSLSSGDQRLRTPAAALVAPVSPVTNADGVARVLGRSTVELSARTTAGKGGVFVGIGPASAVDRYLASVAVDTVTKLDREPWRLTHHVRAGTDAAAPTAQRFWVAEATGPTTASLRWAVRDGNYRTVIMNADGGRSLDGSGRVELRVPSMPVITVGAIAFGLLLLSGGVLLVARRAPNAGAVPVGHT